MVGAMVEIARSLELQTVAEFVEDQEVLDCIRSLGVDFGQGYHLGRPEPVEIILGEPLAAM